MIACVTQTKQFVSERVPKLRFILIVWLICCVPQNRIYVKKRCLHKWLVIIALGHPKAIPQNVKRMIQMSSETKP
jgi:hypothetical protein